MRSVGLPVKSHGIEAKLVVVVEDVEDALHNAENQEMDREEDGSLVQSRPVTDMNRDPRKVLIWCGPQVYLTEQP